MEFESALLIIPPRAVQAFAYPLRERYDVKSFQRVPAHITLLYPFADPDQIEDAILRLQAICGPYPSFELTLDRYGRFEDTLFLEPSQPEALLGLYHTLCNAFPEYPPYGGVFGRELHPHMTLGRFEDRSQGDDIELPPTPSFSFPVTQLQLYLGMPDAPEPFIPRARIDLGSLL